MRCGITKCNFNYEYLTSYVIIAAIKHAIQNLDIVFLKQNKYSQHPLLHKWRKKGCQKELGL